MTTVKSDHLEPGGASLGPAGPTAPVLDIGPVPEDSDAAEYRAYLQRGETRLSTLHRVAGSFISGAGLLTLLPLLIGGTFSGLLALVLFYPSESIPAPASVQRWLAILPVLASITLPLAALYFLIRDLILFYFTARTFKTDRRGRVYPRFILSGIMVSDTELRDRRALEIARQKKYIRELLVPSPAVLRERILKEAQSVGDLKQFSMGDHEDLLTDELRDFVLLQTASDVRPLPEEAAKMEASIARHQRFLRGLVLRYAKAFLLAIVTTVATIAADGILNLLRPMDGAALHGVNAQYVWILSLLVYSAWALTAVIVVRKPVTWLYADTSDSKKRRTPQSLLNFERSTLAVGCTSAAVTFADVVLFSVSARTFNGVAWGLVFVVLLMTGLTWFFGARAIWTEVPGRGADR